MGKNIVIFLRRAFPFLVTIALMRLAIAWWNPAGMLALIPIFYYTVVHPVPFFAPFAVLMCFALDYNFDVMFVWTSLWCLIYAIIGFQTVLDFRRMDGRAFGAFAIFIGLGVLILAIGAFHVMPVLGALVAFIWTLVLYLPMTSLMEAISHD